ncbi:HlyD family secretion protein [Rhizobium bangladeshense]|uniref:HlyD family secretion protein n=2 Tax=Rhizobium bangladeshense TaxID=1138189 RepID=A0ABS7LJ45_9HYPH|nr:HlyD family secretion protein [Rhizobium bangladeshense]MBX4871459.1 HlyD family secretion protein [Rhizobium bangladeshense]MBX4882773.1 HlyD family secretion protein [Rhizobium bangladeshense]MBX4891163.1 HlyD family secretion protein [Rhizobium bangladeshense]MBY3591245.1 HlyD family secretion protein [Rhizobium bangladeshense]
MRVPSRPEDDEGARAKRSAASEASPVTARGFRRLAIPIVAVAAVSAAVAWVMMDWNSWTAGADRQTTDDAVISADVSTLSAQISGMIKRTPVADYQRVTKGQVLAEIDPREYDAAVEAASANLASAQASLANLANQIELQMAVVRAAEAQNASALAQQTQTEQEFQRQKQLGEATSQHELQQAQAAYLQAEAAVNSTAAAIEQQKAQLKVLQGQEPLLQAEVRAAQANLDTAQVRQSYTRILAPFDGVLGRKLVHEGDVVGAGVGIVAEIPLPNVYVTANFKETQLARMKPGQRADITVDTFPGQVLHGKVADLSPASGAVFALLPPDNATGNYTKVVQRIPVRIDFDADQPLIGQMRPGMSVIVTIDTPAGGDR